MSNVLTRALTLCLLGVGGCAHHPPAPPLPEAEGIARAFVGAFNAGCPALAVFQDRSFAPREPLGDDAFLRACEEQQADLGRLELGNVTLRGAHAVVPVQTGDGDWLEMLFSFAPEPPLRIATLASRPIVVPAARPAPLSDGEIARQLEAFTGALAARGRFAGVVLLAKGEMPLLARAYGLANQDTGAANQLGTRFNLASLSKLFTALAIAQLVEANRLRYDDRLATHVPELIGAEDITIDQLLTHTSGLGDILGPDFFRQREQFQTPADYVRAAGRVRPAFTPGTGWRYSNLGYAVLGLVIERLSGTSYSDFVRQNVLVRAGMRDSDTFPIDLSIGPGFAVPYTQHPPDRREVTAPMTSARYLPLAGGPFGLGYSTAPDLLRFAQALRAGALVRADTFTEMKRARHAMNSSDHYGRGVIETRVGRHRFWGHGGGAWGINSVLQLDDRGYTLIVLSNDDPPIAQRVASFADGLLIGS